MAEFTVDPQRFAPLSGLLFLALMASLALR